MKNILVPVDFSEASHNASLYALSLAHHFDAKLHFVNAVTPPVTLEDSVLASVMITQGEIIRDNTNQMYQEIEALSRIHPVKMDSFVDQGFPSDLIRKIADETDSELIVMGMKGKGKSNSIFGSTTTAVVRRLDYPVFVIPEKASFEPISNITLASDYDSETESKSYSLLLEIAEKFNSKIKIINVTGKRAELKHAEIIGKMKTDHAFSEYPTEFHTIQGENVEEGIDKFLQKYPHDILVMMARSHSFIERLFGKIHTKEMSYRTKKPLLILREK